MAFDSLTHSASGALRQAGSYVSDLMTPSLRLGVTGLSRAGKTVFITSIVRNLVVGGRLPFFKPHAEGRILRAYLEPQPDDAVPRFDYERHLATLSRNPPEWPSSTRRISQLRVTVEYEPTATLWRMLGPAKLHIDIVDYPGEWLTDLALLDKDYEDWAAETLQHVHSHRDFRSAQAFMAFLGRIETTAQQPHDWEQIALEGAKLFTDYLAAARTVHGGIATLSPGRFLMPGDQEGSPLLTFFPLPSARSGSQTGEERPALATLLKRRYDSYKAHIVRPFFRDHFSRIDRQIVLVDALGALNGGADALIDLERALEGALQAFRPGLNSWLSSLLAKRVDHLLFAATKADHLHHADHDRLEALLRHVTDRAIARAQTAGADVKVLAIAALRATREAEARSGGENLSCIMGTPLPGETMDGRVFDGKTEVAVFPGDLPDDPAAAIEAFQTAPPGERQIDVIRFRPPRLALAAADGQPLAMPHIRLDRALDFLLGDRLR